MQAGASRAPQRIAAPSSLHPSLLWAPRRIAALSGPPAGTPVKRAAAALFRTGGIPSTGLCAAGTAASRGRKSGLGACGAGGQGEAGPGSAFECTRRTRHGARAWRAACPSPWRTRHGARATRTM